MDFFTSDGLGTGAGRRPGRDLTARFLHEGGTPWRRPVC